MGIDRLVPQRKGVKAIPQRSSMQPRGESLSIHHMVSVVQPVRPIAVNSRPSPRWRQSRKPRPSRMPTACLVKPLTARTDFLGPTWDSPIGTSLLNLQPPAGPVEPRRAQGWAHGRPWRTRTVIESGHWKAGGPGLIILCSSQATKD